MIASATAVGSDGIGVAVGVVVGVVWMHPANKTTTAHHTGDSPIRMAFATSGFCSQSIPARRFDTRLALAG